MKLPGRMRKPCKIQMPPKITSMMPREFRADFMGSRVSWGHGFHGITGFEFYAVGLV